MNKAFQAQKIMRIVFLVASILFFVFSLCFMTDFKDLFGLRLKANRPIAEFHDIVLQGYTQRLFLLGVFSILVSVIAIMLETGKKVPDRFALSVMSFFLLCIAAFAIALAMRVPGMLHAYLSFDYSKVAFEGGVDYVLNPRYFYLALVFNAGLVLSALAFSSSLIIAHLCFMKQRRFAHA